MTRKKTTGKSRSTRSKRQKRMSPAASAVVLVILIILGGYYLFTGADPLGIFDEGTANPGGTSGVELPAMVGSGGDWWQVYFTEPRHGENPDELTASIPKKLIERINQAQSSIHIAAFEFDLPPVAEALAAARGRGVDVRWITDDENGIEADEEDGLELFPQLEKAGIEVKDDGRSALMHNKFWIFDNQTVWTGSTNITANGNFRNNNNVLVIDSSQVAAIYEREFAEMWAGEFGPTSPSTVGDQLVTIDDTPVQVLFGAEDEVISHLTALVENAQKNIRFMAFSFTDDDLGEAVLARAEAGVEVQGIFETRGSETEYSELSRLYCADVPVRQDGNPGTFHHKVFVIDDQIVVTGSLNFSENANDSNDENVVIVSNRDIAAQYLQEFERRWTEAETPDPAEMNCR